LAEEDGVDAEADDDSGELATGEEDEEDDDEDVEDEEDEDGVVVDGVLVDDVEPADDVLAVRLDAWALAPR
jgi:hypothetical protein